jgi:hypothetical protein
MRPTVLEDKPAVLERVFGQYRGRNRERVPLSTTLHISKARTQAFPKALYLPKMSHTIARAEAKGCKRNAPAVSVSTGCCILPARPKNKDIPDRNTSIFPIRQIRIYLRVQGPEESCGCRR